MAKEVHQVIGIEMIAEAVQDAKENAKINGITNCKFICGKAEDALGNTLKELQNKNCVAIVYPMEIIYFVTAP